MGLAFSLYSEKYLLKAFADPEVSALVKVSLV
jgi:hypothetical protein